MRFCIAGGGTAGLEALLAARSQLEDLTELVLVAPEHAFRYRPMTDDSLFRPAQERRLSMADLIRTVEATWVADRVAAVHEDQHSVLTRAGDRVEFDWLLVAVGAQPRRALRQGHVWVRGADPTFLQDVMVGLRSGEARSVGVVVPRGARWAIPAYELALVLAWTAPGTVTLVTVAGAPVELLGSAASRLVARELKEAGVETLFGVEACDDLDEEETELPEKPRLRLGGGQTREFDHLISLPTIIGPFLPGTPFDAAGFIEVDRRLRACGRDRMWAAGSCVASALEHSALAAGQADAAVGAIGQASGSGRGAGSTDPPDPPPLTGMLLSEQREAWLAQNPVGIPQPSTRCLWWPPGRAVGRMLAHQIAAWDPGARPELPGHPGGLPIRAPVALGCSDLPFLGLGPKPDAETERARLHDIEQRQLMALRRQERQAEEEVRALGRRLDELADHQRQVVQELRAHGYLGDRTG